MVTVGSNYSLVASEKGGVTRKAKFESSRFCCYMLHVFAFILKRPISVRIAQHAPNKISRQASSRPEFIWKPSIVDRILIQQLESTLCIHEDLKKKKPGEHGDTRGLDAAALARESILNSRLSCLDIDKVGVT